MLAQTTILLVEDDGPQADQVCAALDAIAATVWHVQNAALARAALKCSTPNAIVLSITLPDVNGLVLCPALRADAPEVPIIMFGPADSAQRVLALHLGAEDVLSPPFAMEELQARVAAVVRRHTRTSRVASAPAPASRAPLALGSLSIDVGGWRVYVDGQVVHLTPTEFRLLVYLAKRAGAIVGREQLAREVWGDGSMSSSRTIDAYIRRLRNRLVGSDTPQFLHVRGRGYQLVPPP